jgi:aminopeptidase N
MKRLATETTIEALTLPQTLALEALLSGKSMTAAAAAAGVDRTTLWRWGRESFEFQARLNQGRAALQQSYQLRLEALVEKALQTVEAAVERGNMKAALEVLKGSGLLAGAPLPVGCLTVQGCEREALMEACME